MSGRQVYADSKYKPYGASQADHTSVQKTRSGVTMDNFPGRLSLEEQRSYKSSKVEGQWQSDREESKEPNYLPSYSFNQGAAVQSGIDSTSYYQGTYSLNTPANKETSTQAAEQDMEIGFGDSPSPSPSTFEGLERKFHDEIMQLVKEQSDAENAENTRHRERMIEINTSYQEKLQAVRAQQGSRREEFLRKESQTRLHQYQQTKTNLYTNTSSLDTHGYGSEAVTATGAPYNSYAPGRFESYREQPQSNLGKTQATERTAAMYDSYAAPSQFESYKEQSQPTGARTQATEATAAMYDSYAAPGRFESYREQPQSTGAGTQPTEARVPYPKGRIYNGTTTPY